MWFLSSLTLLVIHLRVHLQCLHYSGLFIYIVRYCFAKNPTARVQAASRGIETTVQFITSGQIANSWRCSGASRDDVTLVRLRLLHTSSQSCLFETSEK